MANQNAPGPDDCVTVVRYRVVYEEALMSREEFDRTNQVLQEAADAESWASFEADFVDWGWGDTPIHPLDGSCGLIAFEGDVREMTDDLCFLTQQEEWVHSESEPVPIRSNDFFERLRHYAEK
jgi:hypothetical protein